MVKLSRIPTDVTPSPPDLLIFLNEKQNRIFNR
jgi:hypothetical protein